MSERRERPCRGFWKEVLVVAGGGLVLSACAPGSGAVTPREAVTTDNASPMPTITKSAQEAGVPAKPDVRPTDTRDSYRDARCGPGQVYTEGGCDRPSLVVSPSGARGLFRSGKASERLPTRSSLSQEPPSLSPERLKEVCGIHVVQPGETAWRIARKNGLTLKQLAMFNGMTLDSLRLIYPNQPLVIDMEKALLSEACGVGGQGPEISPKQEQQIVQELKTRFDFKKALPTSCGILVLAGGRQGVPPEIAGILQEDLNDLNEIEPGLCRLLTRMGIRYVRGEPGIRAGWPEVADISGAAFDFDQMGSSWGSRGEPMGPKKEGALLAAIIHEAGHVWQGLTGRQLDNGCVLGRRGQLVSPEIDAWQLVERMRRELWGVLNKEAQRGMENLQLKSINYYQNTPPYSDYIGFCEELNGN